MGEMEEEEQVGMEVDYADPVDILSDFDKHHLPLDADFFNSFPDDFHDDDLDRISGFAADVFHDLHEQMTATAARGRKVLRRVQNIEAALPALEKAIQGQTSHIHFAYVAGSDWHAHIRNEQSHLLSTELPRFVLFNFLVA